MQYICCWHTNSIYLSKLQVNTVINIEVIRQSVFSHARVMVIGVGSDPKVTSDTNIHNSYFLRSLHNDYMTKHI